MRGMSNSELKAGLSFAPLTHELHDIGRRPAGRKAGDVVKVNPATLGNLVARASFGAIRNFTGKHVMVLLLATEVEEVFGRLPG
jgi:hypothetical protein